MQSRTIVLQQKTQRPMQFKITAQTKDAVASGLLGKSFGSPIHSAVQPY